MFGASYAAHIDTIKQHCEFSGIDLRVSMTTPFHSKSTSLKTFVPKHESALLEGQDLCSVTSFRYKYEEMAAVDVLSRINHHAREPLKPAPHIRRLGKQQNANRVWKPDQDGS